MDLDVNYLFNKLRQVEIPDTIYSCDSLKVLDINTFNILSLNVRSIPANLQLFTDIFLSQNNIFSKIDVLGFTETRLDQQLVPMYQIPGYNMFTTCRNRYGGGVALYIASKYISSLYYSLCNDSIECLGVECKILNKTYLCICIYRPPNGDKNIFLNVLLDFLTTIRDKFTAVFILGDFNINLIDNINNLVREFITLMYSFSLFQVITKPTRVTDNTASLLDHLWTTEIEFNLGNFIIETDFSDHFPILSQFKLHKSMEVIPIYKKIRIYSKLSLENFSDDISKIDWSRILQSNSANESYNLFQQMFKENYEKHFPVKQIRINSKNERSPHVTPALKNSIRERNRLQRLATKWPLTYREIYRKYRNKLNSLLKLAKNKYYKNQLKSNQGKPKSHWKIINSVLGKSTNIKMQEIVLKPSNSNISNKFNEHFLSLVSSDLWKEIMALKNIFPLHPTTLYFCLQLIQQKL